MVVCFRQAADSDIPSMTALWQMCFPEDNKAFVERFFAKFPAEYGFVACKAELLAMLFLLPAVVKYRNETYPVRYLYAGCTHPAHRQQGIYKQLLSFAAEQASAMGADSIYLHPATDSLVRYYEKCGYRTGIGEWIANGGCGDAVNLSAEEYLQKRALLLPSDIPVWQLEEDGIRFFLQEMLADGWKAVGGDAFCGLLSQDGSSGYDCHGIAYGNMAAGSSGTVFRNTAMWLPIGESPLSAIMENQRGYTAFLGDI